SGIRALAGDRAAYQGTTPLRDGRDRCGSGGQSDCPRRIVGCREHYLPHEGLTARETTQRFPGYKLPDQYAVVYQPDAGFVASERSILAHASLAVAAGAEIHGREKVLGIEPAQGRVVVVTDQERYEAARVIVSTGGWI